MTEFETPALATGPQDAQASLYFQTRLETMPMQYLEMIFFFSAAVHLKRPRWRNSYNVLVILWKSLYNYTPWFSKEFNQVWERRIRHSAQGQRSRL